MNVLFEGSGCRMYRIEFQSTAFYVGIAKNDLKTIKNREAIMTKVKPFENSITHNYNNFYSMELIVPYTHVNTTENRYTRRQLILCNIDNTWGIDGA